VDEEIKTDKERKLVIRPYNPRRPMEINFCMQETSEFSSQLKVA